MRSATAHAVMSATRSTRRFEQTMSPIEYRWLDVLWSVWRTSLVGPVFWFLLRAISRVKAHLHEGSMPKNARHPDRTARK